MNQMVANENNWHCFNDTTSTQTSGVVLTDIECVVVVFFLTWNQEKQVKVHIMDHLCVCTFTVPV